MQQYDRNGRPLEPECVCLIVGCGEAVDGRQCIYHRPMEIGETVLALSGAYRIATDGLFARVTGPNDTPGVTFTVIRTDLLIKLSGEQPDVETERSRETEGVA